MTAVAEDVDLEALYNLTADRAEVCVWTDEHGTPCRLEAPWLALWAGECRCKWTVDSFLCHGHRDDLLAIVASHGRKLKCRACLAVVVLVSIEAVR